MRPGDFGENAPGELVEVTDRLGIAGLAFLPNDLPPKLSMSAETWGRAESAAFALGKLNGLGSRLPNPALIARPFARKEALASSRIEGTRADFGQLALFEADLASGAEGDVGEVANYVRALEAAWSSTIPAVSVTGIQALHQMLLRGVRGSEMNPGHFRTVPVMIGVRDDTLRTARFVPTPAQTIQGKISNLVEYSRSHDPSPRLVRLAIMHYQFETVHPFNDGNGRVGRLLIPLQLHEWGQMAFPLLYISEYFERYRDAYINGLYRVSTNGDWENWITFFLTALESQAQDAYRRAESLLDLQAQMRAHYQLQGKPKILPIVDDLFARATTTFSRAQELTGLGKQAANSLVRTLIDDDVLIEVTGRQRNQIFFAPDIARVSMGISHEESDNDR